MADVYPKKPGELPPPINNAHEGRVWVVEQVEAVLKARVECDSTVITVRDAQRAERRWLVKLGSALGVIGYALRVGHLDAVAYEDLRARVIDTMLPTVRG